MEINYLVLSLPVNVPHEGCSASHTQCLVLRLCDRVSYFCIRNTLQSETHSGQLFSYGSEFTEPLGNIAQHQAAGLWSSEGGVNTDATVGQVMMDCSVQILSVTAEEDGLGLQADIAPTFLDQSLHGKLVGNLGDLGLSLGGAGAAVTVPF